MTTRLLTPESFPSSTDPAALPARPPGPRLVRFGHPAEPPAAPGMAHPVQPPGHPGPPGPRPPGVRQDGSPAASPPYRRPAAIPPRRREPATNRTGDLVTFGQMRRPGLGQGAMRQLAGTAVGAALALAVLLQRGHPDPDHADALLGWIGCLAALSGGIGLVCGILARRGWGALALPAVAVMLALQTVCTVAGGDLTLVATLGGTLALALMLDRMEAIGDLRSLMGFGLALAILLPLAPSALPGALLAIALLPVASRDMRDIASAQGVFLLVLMPGLSLLLAAGIVAPAALAAMLDQLGGETAGAAKPLLPWSPNAMAAPLLNMLALLLLVPGVLLVLGRLRSHAAERARPVTALYALAIGPVTLLACGLQGRADAVPVAAAAAMAGVTAWLMTTRLGRAERAAWVAVLGLGAALGWALLWLGGPDGWRAMGRWLVV